MENSPEAALRLVISPTLAMKMDRDLITHEDVLRVVTHCEGTGDKLLDNNTGDFIGHLRTGALTCWVRYRHKDSAYALVSVYTHRVKIEEGGP